MKTSTVVAEELLWALKTLEDSESLVLEKDLGATCGIVLSTVRF